MKGAVHGCTYARTDFGVYCTIIVIPTVLQLYLLQVLLY